MSTSFANHKPNQVLVANPIRHPTAGIPTSTTQLEADNYFKGRCEERRAPVAMGEGHSNAGIDLEKELTCSVSFQVPSE